MLNVPYVIGAKPQSAVVTQPVTLNAAQTITVLNSGTCVLLKNGEAQSTPCSYAAGDSDRKPQSAVVTQPVTLNAAQTITVLNSGTCVLLKNGEAQSTPCSYAAGD